MNYFIEGLQGSGKSTLVRKMSSRHPELKTVMEGEYSPVELAWCAYMAEEDYQNVLKRYPSLRDEILAKTYTEGDRRIVCYTKVMTDDRDFYKDLEQYEIYNARMPYEEYEKLVLDRYRRWAGDNMLFECSLLQNTVEEMVLFRNRTADEIMEFYKKVRDALEGKDYEILYLKTEDIRGSLDVIRKERCDGNGNEVWFNMLMGFFNDCPYSKLYGRSGEDDLIEHLTHRQNLELIILHDIFRDRHRIIKSKSYSNI